MLQLWDHSLSRKPGLGRGRYRRRPIVPTLDRAMVGCPWFNVLRQTCDDGFASASPRRPVRGRAPSRLRCAWKPGPSSRWRTTGLPHACSREPTSAAPSSTPSPEARRELRGVAEVKQTLAQGAPMSLHPADHGVSERAFVGGEVYRLASATWFRSDLVCRTISSSSLLRNVVERLEIDRCLQLEGRKPQADRRLDIRPFRGFDHNLSRKLFRHSETNASSDA